jgi:mono/diheme cytochrome c family protein
MRTVALVAALALPASAMAGQKSGTEVYAWACAACHGADGRGQPRDRVGFHTPIPDFTDCSFATPEPDADWAAIVAHGGPVRAFDRRMPAFGEALSPDDIQRVVDYVRGFCTTARAWPRGELNLPRALLTEKAFPENEAVVTVGVGGGDERSFSTEVLYERRLGARSQYEVVVPFAAQQRNGSWSEGIGDIAVAVKHVLHHNLARGSILSAAVEMQLPTGSEIRGLGSGVTIFEPFIAYGQILPRNAFLQFQAGVELPSDGARAEKEGFWRAVLGTTMLQGGVGRSWSPMVELLGGRASAAGSATSWDVVPQMQVTLSRRQHIMLNAGVRIPVTERDEQSSVFLTYLLWDWFDGGFFDGWR